jgi:selenoprotein W-related protein
LAVSLTTNLIKLYESEIQTISLTPSTGGRFEVSVDDQLLFSKIKEQRKAYPDEIEKLVGSFLKGR